MKFIKSIVKHEGFKSKPYIDPLVEKYPERYKISKEDMEIIKKYFNKLKVTFGYGFTFITKEEAEAVLKIRLENISKELSKKIEWYKEQPREIREVLIEMAYQIGIDGLLGFKKTLTYLKEHKYKKASIEMLDSLWAKQTPNRAKELSDIIKGISNGIKQ